MTVWTSNKMAAGVTPKILPDASGVTNTAIWTTPAAVSVNDTVNMMQVGVLASGNGPAITWWSIDTPALDTNGTPLLTVDFGDTNSGGVAQPQRFLQAVSAPFRAGGIASPSTLFGYLGQSIYTALTTLYLTIHAAPATWVANAKVVLIFDFTYDP